MKSYDSYLATPRRACRTVSGALPVVATLSCSIRQPDADSRFKPVVVRRPILAGLVLFGVGLALHSDVRIPRVLVIAASVLIAASQAYAQTDNRLALGANVSVRGLHDELARGHRSVGFLWRFGDGHTGWGWHWGLNWFTAHIDHPIGGSTVELGKLQIRPFMAGYGYSYRHGRQLFTATLLGGYAFASMALAPVATDAYYDRLGARSLALDTSNTFVLRPGFSFWHDLDDKVGLNVSSAFLVARPRVTIRSTLGDQERRIRADTFQLKVGLVYSIF